MIEPSPPARGPRLPDTVPDALVRALLGALELGLDGIRRKGDTPHGDTGGGTGGDDRGHGQVGRVGGFEGVFDEFVGDKVAVRARRGGAKRSERVSGGNGDHQATPVLGDSRSASRSISAQRCHCPPENTLQPALLVQLPHHVKWPGILLRRATLALHLEQYLDALGGAGDKCGRDGGEEAGKGEFGDGKGLRGTVRSGGVDDAFAEVVTLRE